AGGNDFRPNAINAVAFHFAHELQGITADVAVGGGNDVRDAPARQLGLDLSSIPVAVLVQVVVPLHALVPLQHFDILVWDGFEIDIDRRAGTQAEALQINGDGLTLLAPLGRWREIERGGASFTGI